MRHFLGLMMILLLGSPSLAFAGATGSPREATHRVMPVAIAVNNPVGWLAESYGASVYLGLADHHALRANVIRYDFHGPLLNEDGSFSGSTTDLGIGWVVYPHRLWSGLSFELGVLTRFRDTKVDDEFALPKVVQTDTTTYAGRMMVGWSWMLGSRGFLAVAVGFSAGYETGREYTEDRNGKKATLHVSRDRPGAESYLRLGLMFGD